MDSITFDRTLTFGEAPSEDEIECTFPEAGEGKWSTSMQTSRTPSPEKDLRASSPLQDRVCIVNSAASPGGRLVASGLAAKGVKVCLFDADEDGLLETAEALSSLGCLAGVWALDMASEEAVDVCLRAVLARFGRVDVLVNVIHLTQNPNVQSMDPDTATSTALGVHLCASAHVASRLEQWGSGGAIINVVFPSGDNTYTVPTSGPEKHCLDELTTFTLQMAARLRQARWRVFGICQQMAHGQAPQTPFQTSLNMVSGLAGLCVLLATDVSDHLNGAVLTLPSAALPEASG